MPEYTSAEVIAVITPRRNVCLLSADGWSMTNRSMKNRISQRQPKNFRSHNPAFRATASIFRPALPPAIEAVNIFRKMKMPVAAPRYSPYFDPSFQRACLSTMFVFSITISG